MQEEEEEEEEEEESRRRKWGGRGGGRRRDRAARDLSCLVFLTRWKAMPGVAGGLRRYPELLVRGRR